MTRFRLWLLFVAATVLAGVGVPYGILSDGSASPRVFVFWCLFGVAVVVLIVLGTRGWKSGVR